MTSNSNCFNLVDCTLVFAETISENLTLPEAEKRNFPQERWMNEFGMRRKASKGE